MTQLTTHERFQRMYEHRDADRVPISDYAWGSTMERWQREGMPPDVSFEDYFDLDKLGRIVVDFSPQYPVKVVEETDKYKTVTTNWGVTLKNWKHIASTPDFVDFTIVDRDSWQKAKARLTPSRDRVDWASLKKDYAAWRKEGRWIYVQLWF